MLSVPAFSADKKAEPAKPGLPANYRISFSMRLSGLERVGNFVVRDGSQANYLAGGEKALEIENKNGTSVEYKKEATIVNCVVVAVPDSPGDVHAECQFEIAGFGQPLAKTQARPIMNFQYQTSLILKKGRAMVLVDEADKRVELMIEDAKQLAPR